MAVFRFLLKNDEGEARHVSVAADSEAEAEETVLRHENKKVVFVGDPDEIAALEQRMKEGTLTGADKGKLFAHQQDKPYKIVKAKGDES